MGRLIEVSFSERGSESGSVVGPEHYLDFIGRTNVVILFRPVLYRIAEIDLAPVTADRKAWRTLRSDNGCIPRLGRRRTGRIPDDSP
jgi:hypothetical protein